MAELIVVCVMAVLCIAAVVVASVKNAATTRAANERLIELVARAQDTISVGAGDQIARMRAEYDAKQPVVIPTRKTQTQTMNEDGTWFPTHQDNKN